MLSTGDILLVKTKFCPISWLIRKITKSNWNHCLLVLDDYHILDHTSNRTKIKSINSYSNKLLYQRKFIKLRSFNYDEKMRIIRRSVNIEISFSFHYHKFIISLIQILLKKRPIRLTCSGFIGHILKDCCLIKLPKRYYLMTPEDFNKMGEQTL